jgi:hypothetical protein
MGRTLGSLYCRRNLRIRSGEKPGNLLGQRLIRGKAGQLALPQIEIAPGQFVEIARRFTRGFVGVGGHTATIDHPCGKARSQTQSLPCRTAASALISQS